MTIDPRLVGIGSAILAAVLIVYIPVSPRRVNQTIISIIIAALIFVAAFCFLEVGIALPVAVGVSIGILILRFLMGSVRTFLYHNITRYTRRDFWQRKVGQAVIGGGRRRRRDS